MWVDYDPQGWVDYDPQEVQGWVDYDPQEYRGFFGLLGRMCDSFSVMVITVRFGLRPAILEMIRPVAGSNRSVGNCSSILINPSAASRLTCRRIVTRPMPELAAIWRMPHKRR